MSVHWNWKRQRLLLTLSSNEHQQQPSYDLYLLRAEDLGLQSRGLELEIDCFERNTQPEFEQWAYVWTRIHASVEAPIAHALIVSYERPWVEKAVFSCTGRWLYLISGNSARSEFRLEDNWYQQPQHRRNCPQRLSSDTEWLRFTGNFQVTTERVVWDLCCRSCCARCQNGKIATFYPGGGGSKLHPNFLFGRFDWQLGSGSLFGICLPSIGYSTALGEACCKFKLQARTLEHPSSHTPARPRRDSTLAILANGDIYSTN